MSKRLTEEEKLYQKRQATVGLASNILGVTAGGAALASASKNKAFKSPSAETAGPVTSKLLRKIKMSPANQKRLILAGAGGAVGLQAANLGGDLVTNRVLAREVNKNDQSMISKAEGSVSRNGHGKSLTYASNAAIGAGTGATVAGAGLTGAGYQVLRNAKKYKGQKALGHGLTGLVAMDTGIKTAGIGGGLAATGLGLRAYNKKKNSQSDVMKADKYSDSEKRAAVAGGTVSGGVIGATAGLFVKQPKSKLKKDPGNETLPKGLKPTGSPVLDRVLLERMDSYERDAHKQNKKAYDRMNSQFEGIVEQNKLKPSKLVRAKLAGHKLSSNRYVAGGAALGGGAVGGLEYMSQKSKSVNKADRSEWSEGRKTKAKYSQQRLIAGGLGATSPAGGVWGPAAAGAYSATQAQKGKKIDAGERVFLRSLGTSVAGSTPGLAAMAVGVKRKNPALFAAGIPIGTVGSSVGGAHGASRAMGNAQKRGDIKKAYRRFDPEADRQRRLGMYGGIGVGGAIVAGREAARNFETKVKSGSGKNQVTNRGVFAKPGKGKKGLGLAAIAAASGAAGVGSYKRGLSQRNQPWT
jgi:hypothetical protein